MEAALKSISLWFNNGGPYMWAILTVLALACAVICERLLFYYLICGRRKPAVLVSDLAKVFNQDKIDDARTLVASGNEPLFVLLRAAVDRYGTGMSISEIQEGWRKLPFRRYPGCLRGLIISLFSLMSRHYLVFWVPYPVCSSLFPPWPQWKPPGKPLCSLTGYLRQ